MNEVLSMLTGTKVEDSSSIIDQGFNSYNGGCTIKTFEVHSICNGTVLAVARDPHYNRWCITVEVNSQKWVRYCNLSAFKVTVGQSINENDLLGYGYKNMMRFEYCTPTESQFPVRTLDLQLYKQDPTPILFGMENLAEAF